MQTRPCAEVSSTDFFNSKCEAERGIEREKRGEGDGKEERKRHHIRKVLNTPVDPVAE